MVILSFGAHCRNVSKSITLAFNFEFDSLWMSLSFFVAPQVILETSVHSSQQLLSLLQETSWQKKIFDSPQAYRQQRIQQ